MNSTEFVPKLEELGRSLLILLKSFQDLRFVKTSLPIPTLLVRSSIFIVFKFFCINFVISIAEKCLNSREQMNEFPGFALALKEREMRAQNFLNPFDIPRSTLLDQVARMRANFLQSSPALTKLQDEGCFFLINLLFLAMKCVFV